MFYINHTNFALDYGPYEDLKNAMKKAEDMGFECTILEGYGDVIASWSPISGWKFKG